LYLCLLYDQLLLVPRFFRQFAPAVGSTLGPTIGHQLERVLILRISQLSGEVSAGLFTLKVLDDPAHQALVSLSRYIASGPGASVAIGLGGCSARCAE
jgi:hypothetical protein